MNSQIIKVTIKGTAPLLQHRFPEETGVQSVKKNSGGGDYSEMAEQAAYKLPDGTLYQPSAHIERSMQKAATNFKILGKRGKTYMDLIKSSCYIAPDAIPHIIQDYTIDRRSVIIQRARIMRERPILKEWELAFDIIIMDKQLKQETVKEILDYAGAFVGIGDYRPKFGRFMVVSFLNEK